MGRNEVINLRPQRCDFFDSARADELLLKAAHETDGFYVWLHRPVHKRHFTFVFIIGANSETSDEDMRTDPGCIPHGQSRVRRDFNLWDVRQSAFEKVYTLLRVEHQRFLWQVVDPHNHIVEQLNGPPDDVQVAICDRIKCPGVERFDLVVRYVSDPSVFISR